MKYRIRKNTLNDDYSLYHCNDFVKYITIDEAIDIFNNSYIFYLNISNDNTVLKRIVKPIKIINVIIQSNEIRYLKISDNINVVYTNNIYDNYEECVKDFNDKLEKINSILKDTYTSSIKIITEKFATNCKIIKESKINIRAIKLNNILEK